MRGYLLRRLGQSIIALIGVTIIVFIIVHLLPGGPAAAILGPHATSLEIRQFNVQNGYNKPVWVQYAHYVGQVARGDLGYSYANNETVNALIAQDLPKTALLVGTSYILAIVLGVPLGILQAIRRNKPIDYLLTGATFVGYSMPVFWLSILLIIFFSVDLHVLPSEAPQGATVGAVLTQPMALILPILTLTLVTVALFSRFMRSSAIENLVQDYIRTARAKGVSERDILVRHLLRNSILPIITLVGLSFPFVVSGAVIVESVFNYPGMGLLFWNAATTQSYPVLLGVTLIVALATIAGSLLADILYAFADPRVRYS